jgi:spermidine/putrescine transport system permease protein
LLALPGTAWLAVFFVAPMYVVLAILFGTVDPILRRPIPVWNPVSWDVSQFRYVLEHITGADGFFGPALMRTVGYVAVASVLCLFIAYPVAYYTARFAGRWRGLLLAALIAPFWISYMMRMLAWVNLLQTDGLVNRTLSVGGLFDVQPSWLSGRPSTVILGLVYGYVPYMILPLFAGLDRIPAATLEAAHARRLLHERPALRLPGDLDGGQPHQQFRTDARPDRPGRRFRRADSARLDHPDGDLRARRA